MSVRCQVDRLRIRCRSDGQARNQAVLLEDALRTASFANMPLTGLVLIRRLYLGRVPLSSGSPALSRLIDERLLTVRPEIITLGSAEHPAAQVVWFVDELEPLVVFAGLLARGVEPSSWYWQRLLPGWRCGIPRSDGARLVWWEVLGFDSGITSLVHLVEALLAAGLLVPFVELLPASELPLPALRAAPLIRPLKEDIDLPMPAPILERLSPAWQLALRSGPVGSPHTSWLARAALVSSLPTADQAMHAALLTELAAGESSDHFLTSAAAARFDPDNAMATGRTAPVSGIVASTLQNKRSDPNQEAYPHRGVAQLQHHDPPRFSAEPASDVDWQQIQAAGIENFRGLSSDNAGFALLVRLLQLLDIEGTLEQMAGPEHVCLPFLILRAAAQRLGIDEDDPVLAFIPAAIPLGKALVFQPPPRWARIFTVAGKTTVTVELAVGAWLLAMARFLRCYARLSIGDLVRRSGLVAVSRTHLDTVFSSDLVDLRIRRAGLDVDPGWVPWLGRVVSFHYEYDQFKPGR